MSTVRPDEEHPGSRHGAQIASNHSRETAFGCGVSYLITRTGSAKTDDDYIRDYNAVALLANSPLEIMPDSQLAPLRTRRNGEVDGLSMTQGDIDRLSSADLNRFLESYGLPMVGQIAVRRRQLKKYLGITVVGI